MSRSIKSHGGRAMTDITAQTDPQAPAAAQGDPARLADALTLAADELETLWRGLDAVSELLARNPDTEHAHLVLGVLRERAQAAEGGTRSARQTARQHSELAAPVVPLHKVQPVPAPGPDEVDQSAPYFEIGALALALRETLMSALGDGDGWADTIQSAASAAAHIGYLADAGVRAYGHGGQFADGDGWFMGPLTRAALGRNQR